MEKMNESGGGRDENEEDNPSEGDKKDGSVASVYIREQSGKRFDPDVVKVFVEEILKEEV